MKYGHANSDREYSNVIGRLCLDNIGSTSVNTPEISKRYFKQGSTELPQGSIELISGGVVIIGHVHSALTQRITAGTLVTYNGPHKYFMPPSLLGVSLPDDNLESVLINLLSSLDRTYTKALVERLQFLAEPSDDLSEPTMSFGSLKQFISFMKSHNFQKPSLVLSFSGNVRAEWRVDSSHHFVAEFLPDGLVKFVIFIQSIINPQKVERVAGTTSLGKLRAIMETFGAKWCLE